MATLPSYQEAVQRVDWLLLAAPYVPLRECARLSRVSRRWYELFAPRVWKDPFQTWRLLWNDASHDAEWLNSLVQAHVPRGPESARIFARLLVHRLDLRNFVSDSQADDSRPPSFLKYLQSAFPCLRSLILDGETLFMKGGRIDWLAESVHRNGSRERPDFRPSLLLLSIPRYAGDWRQDFFTSPYLGSLVYLDISGIPGTRLGGGTLPNLSLTSDVLPNLRILKAAWQSLGDKKAAFIIRTFKWQLWSLDLSHNNISDAIIDVLCDQSFPRVTRRSDSYFEVEGKLGGITGGSAEVSSAYFVEESEWSSNFSHPRRYLADAPAYTRDSQENAHESFRSRLDGRTTIADDSLDAVNELLSNCSDVRSVEASLREMGANRDGITHLYLSGNLFTAKGVVKLLASSPGQLERFDCDTVEFARLKTPPWMPNAAIISGMIGSASLFRPVFSPNLQTLRIHHSIVTGVPTLTTDGVSAVVRLWMAEEMILLLAKARLACPQTFVPDMNPRLRSLTLTRVPTCSRGPVIQALIGFLKLAAAQEQAIEEFRKNSAPSSRCSPMTLTGLRHVCLEFEPDPTTEPADSLVSLGDLKVDDLLRTNDGDFSFFGPNGWNCESAHARGLIAGAAPLSTKIDEPRVADPDPEANEFDSWAGVWNGTGSTAPVWADTGNRPHICHAQDSRLRTRLAPAPAWHVAAKVPAGSYILCDAWDAIATQGKDMRKPTRKNLGEMREVVGAIKEFRARTRQARQEGVAQHFFWGGRLEVAVHHVAGQGHDPGYWR